TIGTAVATVVGTAAFVGGFALLSDDDQDNDTAGLLVASGSLLGLSVSALVPIQQNRRNQWIANFYEQSEATALVSAFNEGVGEDLGLQPNDGALIDLSR
ncbi:MAG: hypothetical protein AAF211_30910, partial [Myxococcota bacterium]